MSHHEKEGELEDKDTTLRKKLIDNPIPTSLSCFFEVTGL